MVTPIARLSADKRGAGDRNGKRLTKEEKQNIYESGNSDLSRNRRRRSVRRATPARATRRNRHTRPGSQRPLASAGVRGSQVWSLLPVPGGGLGWGPNVE